MVICAHCKKEINGEWIRMDAGVTVGGGTPNAERLPRDINLHDGPCYGAWMLHRFPWACKGRTVDMEE